MKNYCFIFILILLLLITGSCATNQETGHDFKELSAFSGDTVLLLEPLFLSDILGIEREDEIFEKNLFVGNIEYSGGVIRNTEHGMMIQTRNIAFDRQERYRTIARQSLAEQISTAVRNLEYTVQFMGTDEKIGIAGPYGDITFTVDYQEHEEDGNDNINLPWYKVSVDSLSPAASSFFSEAAGARYLLVPVIEHYYSHSAGWFNDQWAGCGAGIRFTYHILAFDLSDGSKVFHFSDTEKYIEEYSSRISEFLLMQQFTKIEDTILKTILKKLPKG